MPIDTSQLNSARKSLSAAYWNELSDAELLERTVRAYDPEALSGLLDTEPHGGQLSYIEMDYDTSLTTGRKVRCAHCKVNAVNHYKGVVVRYEDGGRVLLGQDCAYNLYGIQFREVQRDFRAGIEKRSLLLRLKQLQEVRAATIELIEQLEANPVWHAYAQKKREFNRRFPALVRQLGEIVTSGENHLMAAERVRDRDAEERRDEKAGWVSTVKLFKEVVRSHGALAGASFFRGGEMPDKIVAALLSRAKATLYNLDDGRRQISDLTALFKGLNNICDALDEQAKRVDDMWPALSRTNFETILGWLIATGAKSYRLGADDTFVEMRGLAEINTVAGSNGTVEAKIQLPQGTLPSPQGDINRLRSQLSGL